MSLARLILAIAACLGLAFAGCPAAARLPIAAHHHCGDQIPPCQDHKQGCAASACCGLPAQPERLQPAMAATAVPPAFANLPALAASRIHGLDPPPPRTRLA